MYIRHGPAATGAPLQGHNGPAEVAAHSSVKSRVPPYWGGWGVAPEESTSFTG